MQSSGDNSAGTMGTAGGVGCCTRNASFSHGLIIAAIEVKPFIWLVTNIKVDIIMDWEGEPQSCSRPNFIL